MLVGTRIETTRVKGQGSGVGTGGLNAHRCVDILLVGGTDCQFPEDRDAVQLPPRIARRTGQRRRWPTHNHQRTCLSGGGSGGDGLRSRDGSGGAGGRIALYAGSDPSAAEGSSGGCSLI